MIDPVRDKEGLLVKVVSKSDETGEVQVVYDLETMTVENRSAEPEDQHSKMTEETREHLCELYGRRDTDRTVEERVSESIEVLEKADLPPSVSDALSELGAAVKALLEVNPGVARSKKPLMKGQRNG